MSVAVELAPVTTRFDTSDASDVLAEALDEHRRALNGYCYRMAVESTGHSQGNPRLYELIEHAPKTGKSPTVWAWPQLVDYLKVAGQPVQGPWPPHQERRPDPEADSLPVAVPDPQAAAGHPRADSPPTPEG